MALLDVVQCSSLAPFDSKAGGLTVSAVLDDREDITVLALQMFSIISRKRLPANPIVYEVWKSCDSSLP